MRLCDLGEDVPKTRLGGEIRGWEFYGRRGNFLIVSPWAPRSAGLSSNVKRIYRKVGQPPSRGASFLALLCSENLKVNSRPRASSGVERGVSKVHRRKEEISTRNFDYMNSAAVHGCAQLDIDYLRADALTISFNRYPTSSKGRE